MLSFEVFWQKTCLHWAKLAVFCFYFGTLTLLLAILVFTFAQFSIVYANPPAAYVAVGLIIAAIVIGFILVLVIQWEDKRDKDMFSSKIVSEQGEEDDMSSLDLGNDSDANMESKEEGDEEEDEGEEEEEENDVSYFHSAV